MTDLERLKWPDPVLRVKDEMDMHAVAGGFGYVAFKLRNGKPVTHNTYPSRGKARFHAERKTREPLLILEVQPDGMPYKEAACVLQYERTLQASGVRTPDEFETEENSGMMSMPRTSFDRARMIAQLRAGKPLYPADQPYGNTPSLIRKVR
jgi:hypothetical protein